MHPQELIDDATIGRLNEHRGQHFPIRLHPIFLVQELPVVFFEIGGVMASQQDILPLLNLFLEIQLHDPRQFYLLEGCTVGLIVRRRVGGHPRQKVQ
ncbi:hypothetical protein [Opitutus sp. GAS368]|uniref:hypothetical protein n=1 Tax=Opitutus sp. GAS368 TaxID=1882749 RepID=UPI00155FDDCF|nr:hypothetical protein [Opitutus sp. GAS368]